MSTPAEPAADPAAPYWKCVVAALPELVVGTQFVLVNSVLFLPGATRRNLIELMQIEFLAIHSMAFLGLIGIWRPADAAGKRLRAVVFWLLFAAYLAMAWGLGRGPQSAATFLGLTLVTYLGLALNWRSDSALLQLGARWAGAFVVFIAALLICDAPRKANNWTNSSAVLNAGALYFLGLAAIELSGFYLRYIPRNAERILKVLRESKTRRAR